MKIESQIERNTEEESPNESKFNPLSPTSSSSPNHELSFTISPHPQSKVHKSNPSFAIDLSPADKIFFHGHLLPSHYLSNHPVFPRSSTNSFNSFTLPIEELSGEYNSSSNTYTDQQENISIHHINPTCQESCSSVLQEEGRPRKPISFSFFGFLKWRKGCDEKQDKGRQETDRKQKRKVQVQRKYCHEKVHEIHKSISFFKKQKNESSVPLSNLFVIFGEFTCKKQEGTEREERRILRTSFIEEFSVELLLLLQETVPWKNYRLQFNPQLLIERNPLLLKKQYM